jgi:hypothetical protein
MVGCLMYNELERIAKEAVRGLIEVVSRLKKII